MCGREQGHEGLRGNPLHLIRVMPAKERDTRVQALIGSMPEVDFLIAGSQRLQLR